jgi:hypothetical protein
LLLFPLPFYDFGMPETVPFKCEEDKLCPPELYYRRNNIMPFYPVPDDRPGG